MSQIFNRHVSISVLLRLSLILLQASQLSDFESLASSVKGCKRPRRVLVPSSFFDVHRPPFSCVPRIFFLVARDPPHAARSHLRLSQALLVTWVLTTFRVRKYHQYGVKVSPFTYSHPTLLSSAHHDPLPSPAAC
jgi:hypothetical protein